MFAKEDGTADGSNEGDDVVDEVGADRAGVVEECEVGDKGASTSENANVDESDVASESPRDGGEAFAHTIGETVAEERAQGECPGGTGGAVEIGVGAPDENAAEPAASGAAEKKEFADATMEEGCRRGVDDETDTKEAKGHADSSTPGEALLVEEERSEDRREDGVEAEDDGADGARGVLLADKEEGVRECD